MLSNFSDCNVIDLKTRDYSYSVTSLMYCDVNRHCVLAMQEST